MPPEAIPRGYDIEPLTLDEYAAAMRRTGFEIISTEPLAQSVWEAYYEPLRQTVASLRQRNPGDPPQPVEDEIRIWDEGLGRDYWRYAVLAGRQP